MDKIGIIDDMKYCPRCNKFLSLSLFIMRRTYSCYCRKCTNEIHAEYVTDNIDISIRRIIFDSNRTDRGHYDKNGELIKCIGGDLDFEIVKEQILDQGQKCEYSGIKFVYTPRSPYLVSADRIDNNLPHTMDNVKFVCAIANFMKKEYSFEDMLNYCLVVADKRKAEALGTYIPITTNIELSPMEKIRNQQMHKFIRASGGDLKIRSVSFISKKTALTRINEKSYCTDTRYDLTYEWYDAELIKGDRISGLPFVFKKGHPLRPSIDRIDPMKGYTQDNVQVVAAIYNYGKNKWDDNTIMDFILKLAEFQTKKNINNLKNDIIHYMHKLHDRKGYK